MKFATLILSAIYFFCAGLAHAEIIKDSWFIKFRNNEVARERIVQPPLESNRGRVAFPLPNSGQTPANVRQRLALKGEVKFIFDSMNMIYVQASPEEIAIISKRHDVELVTQNIMDQPAIQMNPGWALVRLDSSTSPPSLNNSYNDAPNNGAGRTIYILDSGLATHNTAVANEFGGRAVIFYDFNNNGTGDGQDCQGHGTAVASLVAGLTNGSAKGASLRIVKVTNGCNGDADPANTIATLNWLSNNAPAGTIVNWSRALVHYPKACSPTLIHSPLEMAFQQAHGAGIISVVGAGNDECNAGDFSPTRIDEVFTVGATSANRLNIGQDEIWPLSRTGIAISTFAPGSDVSVLSITGTQIIASGTSLSTPIVAGLIATACAAAAPYCEQNSVPTLFSNFKYLGLIGSVVGTGGTPLPNGTVSRFIGKSW